MTPLDTLSLIAQRPRARQVWYVAHPLRPTDEEIAAHATNPDVSAVADALNANLHRAIRWLAWIRKRYSSITFIAPWISSVMSGDDDSNPTLREAGLLDADAVVARCDGVVLVGGRVSSGMVRERDGADLVVDLTSLGTEPPR